MDGACSTYGEEERCIKIDRWEDNIKMDLQGVG
jgi:hypothetical protein